MKLLTLVCLFSLSILHVNSNTHLDFASGNTGVLSLQPEPGSGKISAIFFRSQSYVRAELENFEFNAHFRILSATVYFTGTNFHRITSGVISSESLKPVKEYVDKCAPGTIVTFDNIKVKGPDELVRTLPGVSFLLY